MDGVDQTRDTQPKQLIKQINEFANTLCDVCKRVTWLPFTQISIQIKQELSCTERKKCVAFDDANDNNALSAFKDVSKPNHVFE